MPGHRKHRVVRHARARLKPQPLWLVAAAVPGSTKSRLQAEHPQRAATPVAVPRHTFSKVLLWQLLAAQHLAALELHLTNSRPAIHAGGLPQYISARCAVHQKFSRGAQHKQHTMVALVRRCDCCRLSLPPLNCLQLPHLHFFCLFALPSHMRSYCKPWVKAAGSCGNSLTTLKLNTRGWPSARRAAAARTAELPRRRAPSPAAFLTLAPLPPSSLLPLLSTTKKKNSPTKHCTTVARRAAAIGSRRGGRGGGPQQPGTVRPHSWVHVLGPLTIKRENSAARSRVPQ